MKKLSIIIVSILLVFGANLTAQNVGIGTSSPDPSAALDIVDTNKGVLLPRLTTSQRISMANPVQSLLVFDMDTNSFWWRDGNKWVELASSSNGLNDSDRDTGVYVEQTEDEDEVTIDLAGVERARFFGDQLYLRDKLSLGTYSKRGMITMRGPDNSGFGPIMYMYGTNSDQIESGRLRFVEGTALGNWRGAFMHYDGSANLMHLGTHNTSDSDVSSDFNAMTIKRINGFVGINQQNPQHRLSVAGDVKINDGGITIETNQQEITLQAGTATVKVSANGDISITSPGGDIDLSANNITIAASNNIIMTASNNMAMNIGNNLQETVGQDIEIIAGNNLQETAAENILVVAGSDLTETVSGNIEMVANNNILSTATKSINTNAGLGVTLNAGTNMFLNSGINYTNIVGGNTTFTTGGTTNMTSSGITDIKGSLILLNASTGSNGAARILDKVNVPSNSTVGTITNGSNSVKIGN